MTKRFLFFLMTMILSFSEVTFSQDDAKRYRGYEIQRDRMVRIQIQRRGVRDPLVLKAMRNVQRHLFVKDDMKSFAYDDSPLPHTHGQTISQPYIVAFMTEALGLSEDDRVLEIGTGTGYQAAVLAEIAKEVYSIEIVKPLAEGAEEKLKVLGYENVKIRHGDGYQGWSEYAPFDAIIVTAAPPEIPKPLIEQLGEGGRMVIPVGVRFQELELITKTKEGIQRRELLPVRFVPMVKTQARNPLHPNQKNKVVSKESCEDDDEVCEV